MPDAAPLLSIRDLRIGFPGFAENLPRLGPLSLDIGRGECVALVGPSGSGKTAAALAILRLVEFGGGRIPSGQMIWRDPNPVDLAQADAGAMQRLRGDCIAMVFQEPMAALNPMLRIGTQLAEVLMRHRAMPRRQAMARALDLLQQVAIPDPALRLRQYPHQLSGGMLARVVIAMAMACTPRLLICDEPTTALDAITQAQILALIDRLRRDSGMAVLLITHDMRVVARLHARVVAMPGALPAPLPMPACPAVPPVAPPVMQVRGLNVAFRRAGPSAVQDVAFDLYPGQTLALVGPSGAGKSTVARAILRLTQAQSGQVLMDGRDIMALGRTALRHARRDMQMVFQDPLSSLDPQMRLGEQVAEPLLSHRITDAPARVAWLFDRVGLSRDLMQAYPHQLSGGQRQRVAIARALASGPRVLIADEPVSSLDAALRAQVVALLAQLQAELGLAMLFISHDMALVARIAHQVAVIDQGRIVESGPLRQVMDAPQHAVTRALLAASGGLI